MDHGGMSEEKEAIQKLYKWHDSFAASPPDTPMQAVDGIIHSCQSWRDKVTELKSRIERCRDLMPELEKSKDLMNVEYGRYKQAKIMMNILEGKA